jgi:serine/threonine-protein kinase
MKPDTTSAEDRVGTLLGGKYELRRVVGVGGMGAVYEARNAWTGRRVAIKVLHPELARRKEVLARFIQEAQAATRIAHPGVVEVLDLGQDVGDGAFYLVQEFLEGADLRTLMDESGPMSARRAVELMAPVMAALAAAHARGVVHRDVKPENVVVTRGPDGAVAPKLIDFGVSKLIDRAPAELGRTTPGTTLGTPYYMSPEQCRGEAGLDGRSDVWGVGAVLYEMLAGSLPFEAPSYAGLVVKIVTEAPAPLATLAPDVPPALAALVHLALTADPDARIPSMEAFLEAVRRCPLDGPSLAPPPPARDDARLATPMEWACADVRAGGVPRRRAALPAAAGLGVACALLAAFASRGAPVHSAPPPAARPAAVVVAPPVERVEPAAVVAPVTVTRVPATARPRATVRRAAVAAPALPPPVARSANGAIILPP